MGQKALTQEDPQPKASGQQPADGPEAEVEITVMTGSGEARYAFRVSQYPGNTPVFINKHCATPAGAVRREVRNFSR